MVLPNVLLAEVCTNCDFVGEQLNSCTSLSKESIGIGLLLESSTDSAGVFLLVEVSVSQGEEGGVDSEWGEEGVDMEMEERVLLPPRALLSLSISARFNLKPSEGIPDCTVVPGSDTDPEAEARAGDDMVEWALRGELVLALELEEKKREALPRETPRPLLPAAGWFWALLCSMESRDCCLSKILGMDSLPFFFVVPDEEVFSDDEEEDDTFLFGEMGRRQRLSGQQAHNTDMCGLGKKIESVGEGERDEENR